MRLILNYLYYFPNYNVFSDFKIMFNRNKIHVVYLILYIEKYTPSVAK